MPSSFADGIAPEKCGVVQVRALSAGRFSLPENQFVSPCVEGGRKTVPSLCFLIQHKDPATGKATRIVFDLGLRRDINRYSEPIRRHTETRQPMSTDPDVVKSLKKGGLMPDDIDYVIYSHVHWDHVGEPQDFLHSKFIVGRGSLDLLSGKSASLRGTHSFFEDDLLDMSRTIELPDPTSSGSTEPRRTDSREQMNLSGPWSPLGYLPSTIDLFGDGSLYVVDAPGHLPGHINLLARTERRDGGGSRWVYLAGDACHDRRIFRKERDIGEWYDAHGHRCCIHANRAEAELTIDRIRTLESEGVEIILAHDVEWESDAKNHWRFLGALQ